MGMFGVLQAREFVKAKGIVICIADDGTRASTSTSSAAAFGDLPVSLGLALRL